MNKKGQTLVIFIILIPLLLILGAFIVDNSMMVYKNLQLKNTTKDIIKLNYEKRNLNDEEIKDIFMKNDIPVDDISIKRENEELTIDITYFEDSIFGKLVNIKSYEISSNVTGYVKDNKVLYK